MTRNYKYLISQETQRWINGNHFDSIVIVIVHLVDGGTIILKLRICYALVTDPRPLPANSLGPLSFTR